MSEELNPAQQSAVHHVEGPALIIAGAGSGKTRVVTFRIAHLLSIGIPSDEILAVTFTNKAAEEMRHRVEKLARNFVLACTFHSLGARILRESIPRLGYNRDFTIYDEDDTDKLLKDCLIELNIREEKGFQKTARMQISGAKNSLLTPEAIMKEDGTLGTIYQLYQAKLKSYQAVDFDDLLYLPILLFQQCPDVLQMYQKRWSFILIDEYQDTNAAQHTLAKLLAAQHQNVFAVGDPDQSIYSWRGANVDNILNFERDFPGAKIITLDQNYRSRSTILNAANGLIKHNISRYEKNLWSALGPGEKIKLYIAENDHGEAEYVARQILQHHDNFTLNDCVIFYRTNFQSRIFEDMLLKLRIPYTIIGGLSFYQRREIKDILCLLRMVIAGADFIAFSRTINLPKRGLGEAALTKLREAAAASSLPIFDYCHALAERKADLKLNPRQLDGLTQYVNTILALREMAQERISIATLVSEAIERSRYNDYLKEDPESYEERRENLAELASKAAEWEQDNPQGTLANFLEELSLKTTTEEPVSETVKMMTLHNGKGLEFSVVFLVGMEEDLFPHVNVKESEDALQEERRLCYVGMTRAKEHLYLTAAKFRFLWGGARLMRPSRFLNEIPPEYIQALNARPIGGESSEEFARGDTVHHRDFGLGIIQKCYETSLGLTYDVFFPQSGETRSLVAKYAKLLKSSEDMAY
ncbi:MAG: UvrD-helicase domain-containing protein [Verrucomicrobia bacterium]|nr:UvrD-helicase domain-containing protein [Verrucomicrobiota bacterium]